MSRKMTGKKASICVSTKSCRVLCVTEVIIRRCIPWCHKSFNVKSVETKWADVGKPKAALEFTKSTNMWVAQVKARPDL